MSKKQTNGKDIIKELQLKMLRIQQCVWHNKERVIIAIEGFDASGKGGSIRRVVEKLDPRGYRVHPIGPPKDDEQGKHYLYRFWVNLPSPGIIAIFDRTWYGRVLVERVDKLIPKKRWEEAYQEINQFEKTLVADGVTLIKIFIKVSKKEQYKRFEERLNDPYKHWKITEADIEARKKWSAYATAVKDMISKTSTSSAAWYIVDGDDKDKAREEVLSIITSTLKKQEKWTEKNAKGKEQKELTKELRRLK